MDRKEYFREYYRRPKVRERHNKYMKKWRKLNPPTIEQREKHIQYCREYSRKNREKLRQKEREKKEKLWVGIKKEFKMECTLCNAIDRDMRYICFHEIHGRKHPKGGISKLRYILEHKQDFTCLCFRCHRAIHILARGKPKKAIKLVELIK